MKIIGLTGSIGMGKSTTAALFRLRGIPVYDADRAVHRLCSKGGQAVPMIARLFPGTVIDGAVDRARLGGWVFRDPKALKQLENILHPLLAIERGRFIRRARRARRRLIVLDIPLLFETGGATDADYVVVVSCPAFLQQARVMSRPGMSLDKLAAIRAQQMPDAEKRQRADQVIPTGIGPRAVLRQIDLIRRRLES